MKRFVLANLISSSSSHSSLRKTAFGLALVLLVILLIVAGMNMRTWLNKTAGTTSSAPTAAVEPKTQDQGVRSKPTPTQLDSVLITINRGGFYPAALSRPKGKFFLLVENRSEAREVDLRIDRVAGDRLRKVKVSSGQLDWTELLDLSPGEYRLTEAKHPDWVCHITITYQ